MRRFLHLIHGLTDHWQELRTDETVFDITRIDIHCLYADFEFAPDHCGFCEARYLEPSAAEANTANEQDDHDDDE